ncbi:MAG: hypothetical protein K6G83_02330 [Lachnospiraceae bacterium]|nr:hypothetical protein [Lachnospiraceae bacterium]
MANEKNMELKDETMAKAAGGAGEFPQYDMMGFVVDKLPTEQYANHYNVKGDNDEIFICYYNGSNILAPGTKVYMFEIQGGGWKIEPVTLL